MNTTGIAVEHEDIVEELNAARMRFWRAAVPQGAFEHRVSPLGNTHGILPHERQMAETSYPAVAAIDVERLKAAAQRAADEIIKLRAEKAQDSATIDRTMQTLDMAIDCIEQLKRHRDDLLEANNRYLERARAAEAEIRRRDEKTEDTKQRVQQILRDKVTSSSDLAETIADLGKFIDMIEARAMAVDGPPTPFCEELHAASAAEKERFEEILGKLYQFRKYWVKPPLVTPEWVREKAALEDGHDPTTGARLTKLEDARRRGRNLPAAFRAIRQACNNLHLEIPLERQLLCETMDSLDFIELLIEIEKTSGVLIDENELPNFHSCGIDCLALKLAEKLAKAGAA